MSLITLILCLAALELNALCASEREAFYKVVRRRVSDKNLWPPHDTFPLHASQLLPLSASTNSLLIVNRFLIFRGVQCRQLLESNSHDLPCFLGCKMQQIKKKKNCLMGEFYIINKFNQTFCIHKSMFLQLYAWCQAHLFYHAS